MTVLYNSLGCNGIVLFASSSMVIQPTSGPDLFNGLSPDSLCLLLVFNTSSRFGTYPTPPLILINGSVLQTGNLNPTSNPRPFPGLGLARNQQLMPWRR